MFGCYKKKCYIILFKVDGEDIYYSFIIMILVIKM